MKTIWKFSIAMTPEPTTLSIPEGARILAFGMQDTPGGSGRPVFWAEVDRTAPPVDRVFVIMGTGHDVPDDGSWEWRGTVQDGSWVWHVYEKVR